MKHVIIADDDPGIQDVLELILKRSGYQTTIYDNATDLLNDDFNEPDIFIIDKQLHNIDGLDVCRHLKNRKNMNTPVIIFSANDRMNELAISAGADEFLEKPFTIEALIQMIEKYTV